MSHRKTPSRPSLLHRLAIAWPPYALTAIQAFLLTFVALGSCDLCSRYPRHHELRVEPVEPLPVEPELVASNGI